jgi:hypothetical protein
LTTSTPRALASNARRYDGVLWRVVETQHTASTMRLVDSLDEQLVLEATLEASKPKLPPGTAKLHYLLATPFRYRSHVGSRFRGPFDAGVWYGADELRTALAEKSYWQLRFLLDSPSMPDLKPVAHTAFVAAVGGSCIDLTAAPLVKERAKWTHRTSYAATQALAAAARAAGVDAIRYESVRDPERAMCAAVLTPQSFKRPKPRLRETWFIAASRARVRCTREARVGPSWEFAADALL